MHPAISTTRLNHTDYTQELWDDTPTQEVYRYTDEQVADNTKSIVSALCTAGDIGEFLSMCYRIANQMRSPDDSTVLLLFPGALQKNDAPKN